MKTKHKNLSIFVPHAGCPHRCSFCDQNAISGTEEAPQPEYVSRLCEQFLPEDPQLGRDYEIAFFGGSFTAIERSYMIRLLEAARPFVRRGRARGIRCSTRPDAIDREILSILKEYGVTSIELGAQSMDEKVLKANLRGHSAQSVYEAAELIKKEGFELGLQMMVGLYGRDDYMQDRLHTAQCFAEMGPRTVRIYPTLTLENTRLAYWYRAGKYVPPTLEESVEICAKLVPFFEERDITIIKLGLHADISLEDSLVAGPYHQAFRELVESRMLLDRAVCELSEREKGRYEIYVNPGRISQMTGQKKSNISALSAMGYHVTVKGDSGLEGRAVRIERTTEVNSVSKGY